MISWENVNFMSKKFIKGVGVSQGVGIGGIYVCKSSEVIINKKKIDVDKIELEITNLEVAVCKTYIEIYDLYNGFEEKLTDEEKRILDVYNAILDDVYFFEELKDTVRNEFITAENAIDICIKKYIAEIESSDNDYAKQRTTDLNDIRTRLIRNIFSNVDIMKFDNVNSNHIVVIKEISPTLAVTLSKKKVRGVAVQEGAGYLSHASIILRGSGIPTVNGICFKDIETFGGQLAVLDGSEGTLLIEPDDPEIERYKEIFKVDVLRKEGSPKEDEMPLETLDKHKVGVSVNISNIQDYKKIKGKNIDGIGLVRTETLFLNNRSMPSERRQTVVYSSMVNGLNNKPVIIRTIDVGGDKVPGCCITIDDFKSHNNRGIRWSLSHLEDFRVQLRSIIKASMKGNVKISLPMIETVEEIEKCREIIIHETQEISKEYNTEIKKVKIGAVIETKAAVDDIDEILKHVDFISIGTNDLMNQIMGLNRKNLGNEIREYFDPKFLNILKLIIEKGKQNKIFVSVCGEMAADPLAAVVLIGLGADDLSIAPSGIVLIKRTIRDLYYGVAKELVERVLECTEINEVIHVLSGFIDCRF